MYLNAFGRLAVSPSQKVNKCNYKYKLPGQKKATLLTACLVAPASASAQENARRAVTRYGGPQPPTVKT